MLQEPPPTQADLHFRAFGFPVRVSPWFWLISVLLGLNTDGQTPPMELILWVGVVFVSILVHELGHAFTQRHFGGRPWITLYGMGGLASCDDCDRRPRSQILISLAGPAAGFALALVVAAAVRWSGHAVGFAWGHDLQGVANSLGAAYGLSLPLCTLYWEPLASKHANSLVHSLFFTNILWGLVNLLPVYPLDGGRVSRELCLMSHRPANGVELSLKISFVTAIAMAVFALFRWESYFVAMMFGYMAYSNYQTLRGYRASRW